MLAGKIKSVHKKWLKSNDVDEPEEVQSESDGGDETDAADQPDDDDDEAQSESEEDVALVSLTGRSSDPVPAALGGELQDDEPLLPGSAPAAKPSPVHNKPKMKKGASKELSQPESSSSKKNAAADAAPPPASAAEVEQPQQRKSSKKKKRSRAEDVDDVGSSAPAVKKAPRLGLSIQGLLFH